VKKPVLPLETDLNLLQAVVLSLGGGTRGLQR